MYLFPDYNDIFKPGMLKKFVADLHSGKLHREFHYGPDPLSDLLSTEADTSEHNSQPPEASINVDDNRIDEESVESSPPDSTFIKLAPSEKRYTLLRNEL